MSIIKDIKDSTNLDFSHELDVIIFNSERIEKILLTTKNIKKADRNILLDLLNIIVLGYKHKTGEKL